MLVATRSTTTPSVTQHAFINELSLGSLILSTFKVFCPKRADCTHGVLLCRLHTEQDFWADYVAATWQLSCADCTRTVSCADCTRNKILGRLRGIDVASTWHRRGNCRSQNVVQLQASTRLKTVSHERAHRLTPKRSLDSLRANCTKSYSQEVTSLFPGAARSTFCLAKRWTRDEGAATVQEEQGNHESRTVSRPPLLREV